MSDRRNFLSTLAAVFLTPFFGKRNKALFPAMDGLSWHHDRIEVIKTRTLSYKEEVDLIASLQSRRNPLGNNVKLFTFDDLHDDNKPVRLRNANPEIDVPLPVALMHKDEFLPKIPVIVEGKIQSYMCGYYAYFTGQDGKPKKYLISKFRFVQAFYDFCVEIDFNQ